MPSLATLVQALLILSAVVSAAVAISQVLGPVEHLLIAIVCLQFYNLLR